MTHWWYSWALVYWTIWCVVGNVVAQEATNDSPHRLRVNNNTYTFDYKAEDDQFTLYWKINPGQQNATFAVVSTASRRPGWMGFGFSNSGGMVNSRAVVAYETTTNVVNATEYNIVATSSRGLQPVSGANRLSTVHDIQFDTDAPVTLVFTQKYSEDIRGLTFVENEVSRWIFATGSKPPASGAISAHSYRKRGTISLHVVSSDGRPVTPVIDGTEDRELSGALIAHGILMAVSWLILVPMGMVFGSPSLRRRFFPKNRTGNPPYTLPHRATLFGVFLLVTAGFIIALTSTSSDTISRHGIIGIVLYSLLCVQIIIGGIRSAFVRPVKPKTTMERIFKPHKQLLIRTHTLLGQFLWVLSVVVIMLGIHIADGGLALYIVAGIIAVIGCGFFIWSGYIAGND